MQISFRLIALICFGALFVFSCKDDDGGSDERYAVNLTVEKPRKHINLNWEKANFSSFGGYFIMRSTEFIEEEIEPANPLMIIEDSEVTNFIDTLIPLEGEAFYKVYVKLGENYLPSETVGIQYELPIFDIATHRVIYDEENNFLFLFDINKSAINRVDLALNEVTHVLELDGGDYKFNVGDAGMGPEFFISKIGSGKLQVYDATDFTFKEEFNAIGNVQDIELADGVVILAANQSNEKMTVYNRSDWSKVAFSNLADHFNRNLKWVPGGNRSLIDVWDEYIIKYDFDDDWNITSENGAENWSLDLLPEIQFSPNNEFFITNSEGHNFDLSLNMVESLNPNINIQFNDYVFLPSGEKLWGLRSFNGLMFELSFPPTEILETILLPYQPFQAFRTKNDKILIVGNVTLSGEEKTYLDWFEF